jgi:hypothetical protein
MRGRRSNSSSIRRENLRATKQNLELAGSRKDGVADLSCPEHEEIPHHDIRDAFLFPF